MYPEFKARYNIIGAAAVAKAKNDKAAAQAVMDILKLDKEKFRLGHTKVFFRAGIGAWMEEQRENKIGSVLAWLQAQARGKAARMKFKKLQDQKMAVAPDLAGHQANTEMHSVWKVQERVRGQNRRGMAVAPNLAGHQANTEMHSVWKVQE